MHCRKPSELAVKASPLRRESLSKSGARLTSVSSCTGSTHSRSLEFSLVTVLVSPGHTVLKKGCTDTPKCCPELVVQVTQKQLPAVWIIALGEGNFSV